MKFNRRYISMCTSYPVLFISVSTHALVLELVVQG